MGSISLFTFSELSNALLYSILALRADIFVVEQRSAFLDIDGLDQASLHLCLIENNRLIAYARLAPPGVKFAEASIARIAVALPFRGLGLGKKIVQQSINELHARYGATAIRIEAQYDLRAFYATFGFSEASDTYDWGGITYVQMLKA